VHGSAFEKILSVHQQGSEGSVFDTWRIAFSHNLQLCHHNTYRKSTTTMRICAFTLAVVLTVLSLLLSPSTGQQYDQGGYGGDQGYGDQDDFAQDNLYADYAARQQEKAVGGGGYVTYCVLTLVHSFIRRSFIRCFIHLKSTQRTSSEDNSYLNSDWFSNVSRKLSYAPLAI
jgi:hypothetical protein